MGQSCFCGICCKSSPPPVRVAISGAAGQISYSLLPMIAKGDMFGADRKIIVQGLDLDMAATKEKLSEVEMELEDGGFPLLQGLIFTTDEAKAFKDADYVILLGSFSDQKRGEREIMEKNAKIFRAMGTAIEKHAAKDCKVIVVGRPANTNASICSHYAPKIPKDNFFALTQLDQNRAAGQIAKRAQVGVGDVQNVILWGSKCADIDHAYIKGRSASSVLHSEDDSKWLKDVFTKVVQSRADDVFKLRKGSPALATARSIVETVRCLHLGSRKGELVSMGVWSQGNKYGVAENLYFSLPVTCRQGRRFQLRGGLKLSSDVKGRLKEDEALLTKERDISFDIIRVMDSKAGVSSNQVYTNQVF